MPNFFHIYMQTKPSSKIVNGFQQSHSRIKSTHFHLVYVKENMILNCKKKKVFKVNLKPKLFFIVLDSVGNNIFILLRVIQGDFIFCQEYNGVPIRRFPLTFRLGDNCKMLISPDF